MSTDATEKGTAGSIVSELYKVVEPLATAVENGPDGIVAFLDDSGIGDMLADGQFDKIVTALDQITAPLDSLRTIFVEGSLPPPDELDDLLRDVKKVFSGVKALNAVDVSMDEEKALGLGDAFVDHLLIRYLNEHQPTYHEFFAVVGVIKASPPASPGEIDLAMIGDVVQDPSSIAAETLGYGTTDFRADALLTFTRRILEQQNLSADLHPPTEDTLTTVTPDVSKVDQFPGDVNRTTHPALDVPILFSSVGSLGARTVPIPETSGRHPGLALGLYGVLSQSFEEDLGDDWTLKASVSASDSLYVTFQPEKGGDGTTVDLTSTAGALPEVHAQSEVRYLPGNGDDGGGTVIVGKPDATRLELISMGVLASLDYSGDGTELRVAIPAQFYFGVQPKGGFVENVLPEGIESTFELTVGYSTKSGIFFQGEGSLETTIALNKSLGPIEFQSIFISGGLDVDEGPPAFPLSLGASIEAELGPLNVTVKKMGVQAAFTLPENRDGNAGPLQFDVGFKPPSGLGIDVSAGPVSGGGYIEHEPDKHRYAGVLQLEIGDYTIKAVGLLKTKLPGGKSGFSFLLLITAELPPINIGFGFTLNGVGGLLGINRGFKKDPLGDAVRTGNLNSVLFPENVVANAQRIISDLRAIFPPKAARHVVGPMARFGWGTPTLMTLDVGIVLAIPTWKIALLGKISMALPDDEFALVDLNLAIMGFLDIPNKRLEITASLYDSRIAMFSAKGDMAMKSSWGKRSSFMVSIGGFHPRYEPPKSFPDLKRVQAWIPGLGSNLRVRMWGYLAVTPNTFQVGAGVLVHAEAGPAMVHGELSFDALFQFNPFKFVFDFYAKFAVKVFGVGLSIELSGHLEGPKPLDIRGKLTINLPLIPKVSAKVDVSIGSKKKDEPLPESKVFEKLIEELETPQNWEAQLPEGNAQFVTVRHHGSEKEAASKNQHGGGDEKKKVLTHPLGGIAVRQTVVPLQYRIEKFGNARPATFEKFAFADVETVNADDSTSSIGPTGDLEEKFAPAKYRKMSDGDKLSSKAFADRVAGHRSGSDLLHQPAASACTTASLRYETLVTDEREKTHQKHLSGIGGYRGPNGAGHPTDARLGIAPETASAGLQLSAAGRATPTTTGFLKETPTRVGLPPIRADADEGDGEDDANGTVVSEVLR